MTRGSSACKCDFCWTANNPRRPLILQRQVRGQTSMFPFLNHRRTNGYDCFPSNRSRRPKEASELTNAKLRPSLICLTSCPVTRCSSSCTGIRRENSSCVRLLTTSSSQQDRDADVGYHSFIVRRQLRAPQPRTMSKNRRKRRKTEVNPGASWVTYRSERSQRCSLRM